MSASIFNAMSLSLLATASVVAICASPAHAGTARPFNIPTQPAATAIPLFAKQSGLQVLANGADLDGVTTNAVNGSFTSDEALHRLLSGSKLSPRVSANGAVLIVDTTAATAAGASAPASDTAESTVVVVTGFKKSYADAVRLKRMGAGITDSISSDGLGRFPDLNVGEAVQRIPGVQINREAGSRDATINLRGLPGTYARTTLNGLAFAEPILDGSTPLGAFNSDIFSAITIVKSPSAADQPGGLSGNIDLQIQPALGRKDGGFFKAAYEHNDLGSLDSPALTLGYNKHISPDLAVYGIVAYKKEKFRRDSVNFPQYTTLNPATTPNFARFQDYYAASCVGVPAPCTTAPTGTGLVSKAGLFFPSDIRQVVKYNEGDLLTAAGGVEYRISDRFKVGLNGFSTRRNLEKNYTDIIDIDMRNALTVVDPTSAPFKLDDGNYYIDTYKYSNTNIYDSFRSEPLVEQTWGLNANSEWRNDDWRLSAVATASSAQNQGHQTQIDARVLAKSGAGNGNSGNFFSGAGNIEDFVLNLPTPSPAVSIPAGIYTTPAASGPALVATNGDQFIVAGSQGTAKNDLTAVQGDAERFFADGPFSSIQIGARLEKDKFVSTGYRTSAVGVQYQNINNSFVRQSDYADDFFGGDAGSYLRNWQTVDYDYAVAHLQPVTVAPGQTLTDTGWINDPTNGSYFSNNFTNQNDIASAYIMGKIRTGLFGVPIRGNVGLRYEQTDNTITSLDKNAAGQFVETEHKRSYDNLLPSFMMAADLSDSIVLRAAAYKTFVRPQPRQTSPATVVSGSTATGYTVTLGNLSLDPYTAESYDVSLEWYNRPNGLFAIDIFQKDVTGIITAVTDKSTICPSDATAWGLGHLTWNGTACYSDLTNGGGNPVSVAVSGNFNNPNPLRVTGVEVNIQQNLDFLPGFWKNFGGAFNYSYTRISGKNPNGTPATLPGVSKNNFNYIAYYETAKYGIRVVYNYRDAYDLAAGTTFVGAARSVKARGQLDASMSYTVNERVSVGFDAYNLTNSRRTEYQNQELMPRANDYDGSTYTFSVRASF